MSFLMGCSLYPFLLQKRTKTQEWKGSRYEWRNNKAVMSIENTIWDEKQKKQGSSQGRKTFNQNIGVLTTGFKYVPTNQKEEHS